MIVDMADPGVDVRPLVQMTGDAEFNEVFLTDVFVPSEQLIGSEGQGWTVAGSTLAHERGTNFPFKEQVVHETYLARLYDEAQSNGSLDDPMVADALARAYVELGVLRLHNLRTLTRLGRGEEPGPESSWIKLTWTSMSQGMAEAALLVTGRDPASSASGPWARQWLWSKAAGIAGGTSQVQRDIIAGRILGLPR
jgi:alkylation response protein AidB-like acyl-CoA dehydrogenase